MIEDLEFYQFARTTLTKCHNLGALNSKHLLPQFWRQEVWDWSVSRGMFPLNAPEKDFFRNPQFLFIPWLMEAGLQFSCSIFPCVFVSKVSFLKDTSDIDYWFRSTSLWCDLILTTYNYHNSIFHTRPYSEVLGAETSAYTCWGHTIQSGIEPIQFIARFIRLPPTVSDSKIYPQNAVNSKRWYIHGILSKVVSLLYFHWLC